MDIATRQTSLGDLWRPQGPRYVMQPQRGQNVITRCPRIRPPGPNAGPFAYTTYLTQLQYLSSIGCPAYNEVAPLGSLDPLRTTALVGGSALGSAALPAVIGVILAATKHPNGAKAAFIIAGIFAAVGAAGGIFAAQTYAETVKGEL